ncbi:unnamed protein product [Didymodactylos carnosus]|uniref:Uncharacterized protein n=1 Tax=Didymodactylos carnosus TaxID=1234261 RepID=A0A815YF49_9BILA|nr:unnamed protein product [Didymodactylos carnosus]CAF1569943.1 unnamed protein product [Didymodactylos carnosus]CAF4229027.1 unnamed protein product [Didymodactylos carnosus]CAF4433081.1 unnamed protein product [Didymodactylos carnosus]
MLASRIILCSLLISLLLVNYRCEAQGEIRQAVRDKTNRKINEGKQDVRYVKNRARAPVDRANAGINRKTQNTKRKMKQIKQVMDS